MVDVGNKPNILIVEDEVAYQELYEEVLEDVYSLVFVSSLDEAKAVIRHQNPIFEVALIDMRLQDVEGNIDGLDVAEFFRDMNLPTQLILKSGFSTEENPITQKRIKALNFHSILDKSTPNQLQLLKEIISQAMESIMEKQEHLNNASQPKQVSNQVGSVLVVEDDESWQELYEDVLGSEGAGFQVKVTDNRTEAIELLQANSFSVAVIDLEIPDFTGELPSVNFGVELIEFIEAMDTKPKVLLSTGYEELPRSIADRIKANDVFQKEQGITVFLSKINQLVLAKNLTDEFTVKDGTLSQVAINLSGALFIKLKRAQELTGAKIGHLLFPDDNDLRIIIGTGKEPRGYAVPIEKSVTGRAYMKGETMLVGQVENDADYHPVIEEKMQSELAIPIREGEQTVAVLNLESDKPNAFDTLHANFVNALGEFILMLLKNEQRRQELEVAIGIEKEEKAQLVKKAAEIRFVADIVHRLNNPLGAIRAWIIAARKDDSDTISRSTSLKEAFDEIEANSIKSLDLIAELRQIARDTETHRVNVKPVLDLALEKCLKRDKFKHTVIDIFTSYEVNEAFIYADKRLEQVFMDIITNALEAMQPDGGRLKVRLRVDNQIVETTISDTGRGIPETELPFIFDEWYTHKNKSDLGGGSHGIGLWWINMYITAYEGQIVPYSTLGKGTEMNIQFPLATDIDVKGLDAYFEQRFSRGVEN